MEACCKIGIYFIFSIWMANCLRTNYCRAGAVRPLPHPQHSKPGLRHGLASGRSSARLGCGSVPVWRAFSGSRCRDSESTTAKSQCSDEDFFFFFFFFFRFCFLSLFFLKENSAAFQPRPPRIIWSLEGSGSPHACPLPGSVSLP